jgi:uncharacterized protein YwqG
MASLRVLAVVVFCEDYERGCRKDANCLKALKIVRDAILIKVPSLPSPRIANVQSFFGAAPLMPANVPWPRKDVGSRSRPLTFIAQIALHEIPPRISSPLPRAGSLCFFVDLTKEYLDEHDARVIYFEDPFDACVAHRAPVPFADEAAGPWFWLEADELGANRLDKFPMEFMWFSSYAQTPSIVDVLESERVEIEFARWHFESDDWPFAWGVVEHAVRAVGRIIEENSASSAHNFSTIAEEAADWLEHCRTHDALEVLDASTAEVFRANWRAWRENADEIVPRNAQVRASGLDALLAESVRLVGSLCKGQPGSTQIVPPRFMGLFASEWPAAVVDALQLCPHLGPIGVNQMLGYGEPVQSTPVDRVDDVLLLQIKAYQYLNWWPGAAPDGVIQFWISPDDLAAKRFDRVGVNFDCT